jgi:excisionase family DNA binding protein
MTLSMNPHLYLVAAHNHRMRVVSKPRDLADGLQPILVSNDHITDPGGHMTLSSSLPKLLTVAEAAERLGVKPSTIRAWILRREKLEIVKLGRCVRITERSVQKLIDDNTIPPKG